MSRIPSSILVFLALAMTLFSVSACTPDSTENPGDTDTDMVETTDKLDIDFEEWPDNCIRLVSDKELSLIAGTEFEATFPTGSVTEQTTVCYEKLATTEVQLPDGVEALSPIVTFTPADMTLQKEFKITWKSLTDLPENVSAYILKEGSDKEWDTYTVPVESGTASVTSIRLATVFLGNLTETPTDGDIDEIEEEEDLDETDTVDEIEEIEEVDVDEEPPNLCDPDPCNGHGTCNPTDGSCACDDYFAGDACDACDAGTLGTYPNCIDDPCDPDPCNGHGTCDTADGSCTCNDYFAGDTCNACGADAVGTYPDCVDNPCDPDPCNGHGTCDTADGSCTCADNYGGDACDSCAPGYIGEYPDCILPTPLPAPGEIVITEFFAYPPDARSENGEWIEIRNVSSETRRLQLCEIGHGLEGVTESSTIDDPIELEAGETIVLGKTTEILDSGLNVPPDIIWTGWQLNDVADIHYGSIVLEAHETQCDASTK